MRIAFIILALIAGVSGGFCGQDNPCEECCDKVRSLGGTCTVIGESQSCLAAKCEVAFTLPAGKSIPSECQGI